LSKSRILLWSTTLIAIYHIIVAGNLLTWLGIFIPPQVHRAVSLSSALVLIFILSRAGKEQGKVPWYDYVLITGTLLGLGFVIFFYERILDYSTYGFLDNTGIFLSLLVVIPLLEAIRRKAGWILPMIILTFLFITMFQKFLPGILYGQGYPLDRLLYSAYVGSSGIFGLPLNVASTVIIIFLIFGALLERAGAGQWFMNLALSLTGWSRGGPAKAAVLSSALFGSISGSPSGNVATTGVVTIPLMKSIGYKAPFAGAVEAVASTGGQILPPVMGAIAFVMAEWIGVPYGQIAIAALVPALLYFLITFVSVHLQAHKSGIKAMSRAELPNLKKVFKEGWFYLIPLVALVYFLIYKEYSPTMSGIYCFPFLIAVSFMAKDKVLWLTPKKIMSALQSAVTSWVMIAAITGSVGIMVGALELSGLGIKFSHFILDIAGGNLLLTLLFVGIASLILGMGLDSIPAYITLATLMVPALIQLGIPDISAHLFVVYWGLASFITPPVCIAVFVACGISGSKVWETGGEAIRLGIASFIIPFAFVLSPGLLLKGSLEEILLAIGTALIGAILLACGIQGFALTHLNMFQRVLLVTSGIFLIAPGIILPLIGLGVAVVILLWSKKNVDKSIPLAH
jgi:TRAP transporter 4TM/12TM fusion protein